MLFTVPESPDDIKVVSSSSSSLIVSWLPPTRPNGQILSYKVYMRTLESGKERTTVVKPVPSAQSHLEFSNLKRKEAYEFWVTGLTKVGEGQSTRKVHSVISSRTPAAIVSFGNNVLTIKKQKVLLPCVIVGIPEPERSWMGPNTAPLMTSERVNVQSDGTLVIFEAHKGDEGTYTCVARNEEGTDQVNFQVKVQGESSSIFCSENVIYRTNYISLEGLDVNFIIYGDCVTQGNHFTMLSPIIFYKIIGRNL